MAEHMGCPARRAHDPCFAHRPSNHGRHCTRGPEGVIRRATAEEHDIGVGLGTACLEVSHERIANLLGQR
jgi:hypothetical protein